MEKAYFGGGCFWCTEAVYSQLKGVVEVTPGYAGGTIPHPTYAQVSSGRTGHAEVVEVQYDPDSISYHDLLEVFFATHDPTTKNQQGADMGPQYRSVIMYDNDEQFEIAKAYIDELADAQVYSKPIVTELVPMHDFFEAEAMHVNYYARNTYKPYCQLVIAPKVRKVIDKFSKIVKQ